MRVQLEGRQLGCERDERWLFQALEFSIEDGDLCRVEGPNGSGKTSLIKMLTGQLEPSEGAVLWQGKPLPKARAAFHGALVYSGHLSGVKEALTPLENLSWYQAIGIDDDARSVAARWQALDAVGLKGFEDIPVAQLSAGQRRRVGLARLHLLNRPLWILDEPFTAIDREGVAALEHLVAEHCHKGGAAIVTTHHAFSSVAFTRRIGLDGHGGHHVL
ncbi:cytochrome c biogenesis heme-transporting ATPase CcmA [Larsenimonas salina]|uniref:cytochrome c biogenesis heme-transporting ATPase CcmA n=1 Tax=Larsenimonas salina TaxID=1295565 RepID=UPI002072A5CC|nr:cytochrome c biogenesis heme-transporting ATPase CcmA [Larsenimonas salina]MCM5705368.1 cytochrome c biogenesis heme-transporting ATPase CcmA [Larsenimonas salina]